MYTLPQNSKAGISFDSDQQYKVVCTKTSQYKLVLYYSIVHTDAALVAYEYILAHTLN